MSIIRFEDVDVIFSNKPREALALLDQGQTREQILKKTGLVVGVEKANPTSTKARSACSWACPARASRACCAASTA